MIPEFTNALEFLEVSAGVAILVIAGCIFFWTLKKQAEVTDEDA